MAPPNVSSVEVGISNQWWLHPFHCNESQQTHLFLSSL